MTSRTTAHVPLGGDWDNRPETARQVAGRLAATLNTTDTTLGGGMVWRVASSRVPVHITFT